MNPAPSPLRLRLLSRLRLAAALLCATSLAQARLLVSEAFSAFDPATLAARAEFGAEARATLVAEGTIDSYLGEPGQAARLDATNLDNSASKAEAALVLRCEPREHEIRDLALLSVGFDLAVARLQPVVVRVLSLDRAGAATGSLQTTVYPPVAGSYFRHTLDLSEFSRGEGDFDPAATTLRFEFVLRADTLPRDTPRQALRLDNLSLAGPAYFVSASGDDANDGRTAATAFATPGQAASSARAGDVIMLMEGVYTGPSRRPAVELSASGRPAAWIVFRAHPGHRPVLVSTGWNAVHIRTPVSYLEIRGLTVLGVASSLPLADALADGLIKEKNGVRYGGDSLYNTNGIGFDSRQGEERGGKNHHIRYVANTVVNMPGGGLSAIGGDHITVIGNRIHDNCHRMRYAGSGISLFRAWDFDSDTGYKNFVLHNVVSGNRCYVPWTARGRVSDGNGIIIDDFINYQPGASQVLYRGRTLVQNNLAFGNGGSGVHVYASNHVDVVHNTAYHNALSPELAWRQLGAGGRTRDIRVVGNILHAPVGEPVNYSLGRNSSEILYARNLAHGDGENDEEAGGGLGSDTASSQARLEGNLTGPARFVRPTLDAALADFRPRPDSPAVGAGDPDAPGAPLVDLLGRPRPRDRAPTLGALEP